MRSKNSEYKNKAGHKITLNNAYIQGNLMQEEKKKTNKTVKITFSSTNQCDFQKCLEKIIREHCKKTWRTDKSALPYPSNMERGQNKHSGRG